MARGRVTLDDVAAASEASSATVSLALRNKAGVSRATRERILAHAHSLGYQRPGKAAAADGARLRNIALVFRTWNKGRERSSPSLNRFYSWVLTGIQEAGTDHHLNLLLSTIPVDARNDPAELPERMLRQPLDGLLLVGSFRPETVGRVLALAGSALPAVTLVDASDSDGRLDAVGTDNFGGGYRATSCLLDRGHTRLSFLGPVSEWEPNFEARRNGFVAALGDRGLAPVEMREIESEVRDVRDLDRMFTGATGFVCGNDEFAQALLRAAQKQDLRIPHDLSIIGFDDTDSARDSDPPLTTMGVDKVSMGRLAVRTLAYRLDYPEAAPIQTIIAPRLIERSSVSDVVSRV